MRNIAQFILIVLIAGFISCGGGNQTLPSGSNPDMAEGTFSPVDTPIQYATEFPGALPQDVMQPWEELGSDGKVVSGI